MTSRHMLVPLAAALTWIALAAPAQEPAAGALAQESPGDEQSSDWDWSDIDLSDQPPAPAPEPAPGTMDWDWDDLAPGGDEKVAAPADSVQQPAAAAEPAVSPPPAPETITRDPGWDEPDTGEVSPPAGGEDQAAVAEEPDQAASAPPAEDEWDWDNIDEAAAEPVTETRSRTVREDRMAALARQPRKGSTAEPDFDAPFEQGYALFMGVAPFKVIPSKKDPEMHPCLDCHEWAKSDLTPRLLKEPHDNFKLKHGLHGKGEFWCFTCHHLEGDGGLRTLEGLKLSFDEAYIVCSQCHAQEARDWYFGGHGKRVENWRGTRKIMNCTACHYQHGPSLEARKPLPGPTMRMGMQRPGHWVPRRERGHNPAHRKPIWERHASKGKEQDHE